MSEILFESSFKILVFGSLLAVPFFVMAYHFRDRRLWIASFTIAALIVCGLIVERMVETPREQVVATVYELARVVESNDIDDLVDYISKTKPDTISRAKHEMANYDFTTCRAMMIHDVKIDENDSNRAHVDFMVRFQLTMNGNAGGGFRDVVLTFEKETDGKWRIIEYAHFDPANREGKQGLFF